MYGNGLDALNVEHQSLRPARSISILSNLGEAFFSPGAYRMDFRVGNTGKLSVIVGRPALMVIDMQNDFLNQPYLLRFPYLIPNVRKLLEAARRTKIPIIYTKEFHRPHRVDMGSENYPGTGLMYSDPTEDGSCRIHCVEGTKGVEIVDELAPAVGDYIIQKRRYNAFLGTELSIILNNLAVDTLIISGIFSEVCVLYTAGEAHQLDYHVRLVEDCTAGVTKESTAAAIDIVRKLTTGVPITLESLLRALEESAD